MLMMMMMMILNKYLDNCLHDWSFAKIFLFSLFIYSLICQNTLFLSE